MGGEERRVGAPIRSRPKDEEDMTDKKIWFITGAGRGMGVDMARAALAAGHAVVATGRDTDRVAKAVGGGADDLLVTRLDITSAEDAEAAVRAAVDRFGRIDVLVNNAATAQMGFFEEISPEAFRRQVDTNLLGPITVTRAVLPVMRDQRSGLVMTISSTAGLTGMEFTSAYATAKFGLEGWMESLVTELAPFGIRTTIVEPGFFRTELLEDASVSYGDLSVDDYAERTAETLRWWHEQNGQQGGDPAKLGRALVTIADQDVPPRRFMAGADSIELAEQKVEDLRAQIDAFRDLSSSLAFDDGRA
jgi:NAD(P)-dependent dehydrogenase (short-subunit alcohol dehydrogenase family)